MKQKDSMINDLNQKLEAMSNKLESLKEDGELLGKFLRLADSVNREKAESVKELLLNVSFLFKFTRLICVQ